MAQKLFIGGLPFSVTSERLREVFAAAGTVESATVVTDSGTGRSRGFGFVEMATAEEAQRAISELNGKDLDGRKLTVNLSTPKARFNGRDLDGRQIKVELAKSPDRSGGGGGGRREGPGRGRPRTSRW